MTDPTTGQTTSLETYIHEARTQLHLLQDVHALFSLSLPTIKDVENEHECISKAELAKLKNNITLLRTDIKLLPLKLQKIDLDKVTNDNDAQRLTEALNSLLGLFEKSVGNLSSIKEDVEIPQYANLAQFPKLVTLRALWQQHDSKADGNLKSEEDKLFLNTAICYIKWKFPNARPSLWEHLGDYIARRRQTLLQKKGHAKKLKALRSHTWPAEESTRGTAESASFPKARRSTYHGRPVTEAHHIANAAALRYLVENPTLSIRSLVSSIQGDTISAEYPDPPRTEHGDEHVECPYCMESLSASRLRETPKNGYWRDHVNQHLQPYICLFRNCTNSLFTCKSDWSEHMTKAHSKDWPAWVHSTSWFCDLDHEEPTDFTNEKDWKEHMREISLHPSRSKSPTDAQLGVLATRKQRIVRRNPSVCPFCEEKPASVVASEDQGNSTDMAKALEDHIATHVQSLSILALSGLGDDENEGKKRSIFTVPYARDPDFLDRPEALACLRQYCTEPGVLSKVLLWGPGGVGKSQLAVEHAYRIRDARPHISVFWVKASTRLRFEESYRNLADCLKIPWRHDPKTDTLKLVQTWLNDKANGQWMMILDDIRKQSDDLLEDPWVLLEQYLPNTDNGSILITSRSEDVRTGWVLHGLTTRRVQQLDEDQGLQLLHNKLRDNSADTATDALDLLQSLDYMPLAITQAAAYINMRAEMTIRGYLDQYISTIERMKTLSLHPDVSTLGTVTTWQMSFDYIQQERPSAADLLSLINFLNPQGIPEPILYECSRIVAALRRENEASDTFDEDLDILRACSFISTTTVPDIYEIPATVQLCTQTWLSSSGNSERWKAEYFKLIARVFPAVKLENWMRCQQLISLFERLPHCKEATDGLRNALTQILKNAALYMLMKQDYDTAAFIAAKAVNRPELGRPPQVPEGIARGNILEGLIRMLSSMPGFQDGREEKLNNWALERYKKNEKSLEKNHPEALMNMGILALVLHRQKKNKEAEELYQRVVKGYERILGNDHPETLKSMNDLASVLSSQERFMEAEELRRQVLDRQEKTLGKDHLDTLKSFRGLWIELLAQGKAKEAIDLGDIYDPQLPMPPSQGGRARW